jgi:thioredoxin-related protein
MKRLLSLVTIISCCLLLSAADAGAQGAKKKKRSAPRRTAVAANTSAAANAYAPVHVYDPKRNAEQDIKDALAEAARTGKRVLLEVGGEWCIWCHIMDDYFEQHPELLALREKNFVMVKINYSDENKNELVLSRYPAISGYPHIFVLDTDGKLLHSQDTGKLEEGKSYNLNKFTAFLTEWSPPPTSAAR